MSAKGKIIIKIIFLIRYNVVKKLKELRIISDNIYVTHTKKFSIFT